MLRHQLGQHFVLGLDLLLQVLNPFLFRPRFGQCFLLEGRCAVVEELLLPAVEQALTSKRIPRAMELYRFVLGIVLGLYIGFPRLNQLRFVARDPMLTFLAETRE